MLSRSALFLTITLFGQASGFALVVPSAVVPTRTLQGAKRETALFSAAGEHSPSIPPEVSRRAAVITAAALAAGGTVAAPSPADAYTTAPLFEQVRALETANYIGQIGRPIYEPNSKGDPAKHLPQVKINKDRNVEVWVPHVMTEEHFIQFIWLKDANSGEVVLVKAFPATDPSPPTLTAKVPEGVELIPYMFCNLHGLWKSDSFKVV